MFQGSSNTRREFHPDGIPCFHRSLPSLIGEGPQEGRDKVGLPHQPAVRGPTSSEVGREEGGTLGDVPPDPPGGLVCSPDAWCPPPLHLCKVLSVLPALLLTLLSLHTSHTESQPPPGSWAHLGHGAARSSRSGRESPAPLPGQEQATSAPGLPL